MLKFWKLFEALQKGKELANKENWKNAGLMTSLFSALVAAAVLFLPEEVQSVINTDTRSHIINGLVAFFGVLNAYTHVATSKTVGFGNPKP